MEELLSAIKSCRSVYVKVQLNFDTDNIFRISKESLLAELEEMQEQGFEDDIEWDLTEFNDLIVGR
jgi:hypothetical protein